jgi:D-alanyl-D-alanine carboxypeptidase (penicillin-binding protein 5/6)
MINVRQKISLTLALVFVISLLIPGMVSLGEELDLTAKAAFLMDMKTGQVLYEKEADMRWKPASTTKIMTALIALENASLDMEMKASSNALNNIPSDYGLAGIKIGEILTLSDLLHFMLIISANEAANVIAENISPSERIDDFVVLMNKRAQELGLNNTHYTNTYGLDQDDHYSSARDLATVAKVAMENSDFRKIVALKEVPLPDTNLRKSEDWDRWHIEASNKLLFSTSEHYDRVTGIKTGYTGGAGRCLVFSAVNAEGLELLGVILGTESYDILFRESKELLEYGFKNYKVQTLASSGEFYGRYDVADSLDNIPVDVQTLGHVSHLLPTSKEKLDAEVTVKEVLNTPFIAPIEKGQVLGYKTWYYKGKEIGSVQLVAMNDIEKTIQAKIRDKFHELVENNTIRNIFILTGVIIFCLIVLRIVFKTASRRKNRYRRRYRL